MSEDIIKIGKQILHGDDIKHIITVKGESFTVKFPTPYEQMKIERDIALAVGGVPLDTLPQAAYNMTRMVVTLDAVIEKAPDWWESAGKVYDEDLLIKLWDEYIKAKEDFRSRLQQGKFQKDSI